MAMTREEKNARRRLLDQDPFHRALALHTRRLMRNDPYLNPDWRLMSSGELKNETRFALSHGGDSSPHVETEGEGK